MGLQVTIPANETGGLSFGTPTPVLFPCFLFGFITYKSLGETGFTSYFAVAIEWQPHDGYGESSTVSETFHNMWMPDDT